MSFVNPSIFFRRLASGGEFSIVGEFPTGRLGALYLHKLETVGGTPPVSWSVTAGSLPPGLAIDPESGNVAGVPPPAPMSIGVTGPPTTRGGQRYDSQTSVMNNAPGAVTFSLASGSLPPGLALNPLTGEITGVVE